MAKNKTATFDFMVEKLREGKKSQTAVPAGFNDRVAMESVGISKGSLWCNPDDIGAHGILGYKITAEPIYAETKPKKTSA